MIHVNQVSVRKGQRTILQSVNWQVKQDEHWAILGLNGSGKTSLLKLITGYDWPTMGSIEVLGSLYGQVAIQEVRKKIGWVSTSLDDRYHTRLRDTVLEVVLSGLRASIGVYEPFTEDEIRRGEEAIAEFGLEALVDTPFQSLSQGERKKAFLARAWVSRPSLYILDEPTTGLDIVSREALLRLISQFAQKEHAPTLLYVTHYPEEIQPFITHVLLLKEGQVVASGRKEEMLTEHLLAETFGVPVSVQKENERTWVKPRV
ncbi:ABC transporter ATP-binding protein [Halalkalibacterium ligniniphilum]|uniref:ABC transporter ATP-binding protein n=1 Tax=Halalkalibacterium ligniniphilum TaxID=1134413 RepID=UPI000344F14D|nr:ABC transporter ATP-binding protein [Halalkalibacterium ligniniphilum]